MASYLELSAHALHRHMAMAGGVLGVGLSLGFGFAGRFIFGVLGLPPSLVTLPAVLFLVAAVPWFLWHVSSRRTIVLAETDPHEMRSIWLAGVGGLLGGVLVGAVVSILAVGFRLGLLLTVEFFARWLVSALVVGGLLLGLGVLLDQRRRVTLPVRAPASWGDAVAGDQRAAYVRGGLRMIGIGVGLIVLGVIATAAASALFAGPGRRGHRDRGVRRRRGEYRARALSHAGPWAHPVGQEPSIERSRPPSVPQRRVHRWHQGRAGTCPVRLCHTVFLELLHGPPSCLRNRAA